MVNEARFEVGPVSDRLSGRVKDPPYFAVLAFVYLSVGGSAASAATLAVSNAERFERPDAALVSRENSFWRTESLPLPAESLIEVSGILPLPDNRLLVTTRSGDIWFVDGAYDDMPKPRFALFASGLHEPLGIAPAPGGGYYVVQRTEVTRVIDRDGDGRADQFVPIFRIPVSSNYHEFAFGPFMAPNGNLRVSLMLAYNAPSYSPVPWRGWMLEIAPDGRMTPIAAGFRAGFGVLFTSRGRWLATDNQGEWRGASHVTVIDPGDFVGHPAALAWSGLPGSPVKLRPAEIPDGGEPLHEVAKRLPGLKVPAVWLPYPVLGIAPTDIVEDKTGGKFGPFTGQFFIGDYGQSRIVRMSLEEVKGVWQGAAYAFRQGFASGVTRLQFGDDGSLFVGESTRGWGSVGGKAQAFERVRWTGETPFEIKEVRAQPDGFVVSFTRPVDRATAENAASYRVAGFTYKYHSTYGSPPIHQLACPVRKVNVAPDGLSARLGVECLSEGYIHEIRAAGVRAAGDSATLLHETAFYTLNRRPDGPRIIPIGADEAELCTPAVPPAALVATAKHPSERPPGWKKTNGDRTILLGTLPGMKFDAAELQAIAGEEVQLVFRNSDDMLHNFVLCAPGRGQEIAVAAVEIGLDALAKNFVPESNHVLFHTALVQPGGTDRIFFHAPATPGDYDYVCSVPGHGTTMRGVMHVVAK
jgi:uncharacterized cupredoxin-like copper-binding protein/glucose/arabinose dehydrogenase